MSKYRYEIVIDTDVHAGIQVTQRDIAEQVRSYCDTLAGAKDITVNFLGVES